MTEKVVSLSGGLVLGMVAAFFLGLGTTQTLPASAHFEIPTIAQMTIVQSPGRASVSVNDTTPAADIATPGNDDRGRITRIATLAATVDPVFSENPATATATAPLIDVKTRESATSSKHSSSLRRVNIQRAYIASSLQTTSSSINQGQVTGKQGNFTAIVSSISAHEGYGNNQPSSTDAKDIPETENGDLAETSGDNINPTSNNDFLIKTNDAVELITRNPGNDVSIGHHGNVSNHPETHRNRQFRGRS